MNDLEKRVRNLVTEEVAEVLMKKIRKYNEKQWEFVTDELVANRKNYLQLKEQMDNLGLFLNNFEVLVKNLKPMFKEDYKQREAARTELYKVIKKLNTLL